MAVHQVDNPGDQSGLFDPTLAYALWGDVSLGDGVVGTSADGNGVSGTSVNGFGVYGESQAVELSGVYGTHTAKQGGVGVRGIVEGDYSWGMIGATTVANSIGLEGYSEEYIGVYGESRQSKDFFGLEATGIGIGVEGSCDHGAGVRGLSDTGYGVWGISNGYGVVGEGPAVGVAAFNHRAGTGTYGTYALLAFGPYAGYFAGNVSITGSLYVNGQKFFQVDDPRDPERGYLVHACVESSEMKNIYDGMSVLDSAGEAEVELLAWFEALNTDFRYQLTAVGGSCPNLFIKKEISNSRFWIGGGASQMKVSWQVTGVRKDPWALAHPFEVEIKKPAEEVGHYLHPDLFGAPEEKGVHRLRHPRLPSRTPDLPPRPRIKPVAP
jgi:hypothetical protein